MTSVVSGERKNVSYLVGDEPQRIFNHGDIVIGGLFPIHSQVTKNNLTSKTCDLTSLDMKVLLYSEAMIYAIEQINNSSLLPDVKIGYEIYDTCSDVSMALRASLRLLDGEGLYEKQCFEPDDVKNSVKAVIGELRSEVSVAVARLFTLPLMTQISYASTSDLLSSRSRFPSFFRTVPSDEHQTKAIVQLIKLFNFVPVGIIGSADEYGKYGAESIADLFKTFNICMEFKEILPIDFSQTHRKFTDLQQTLRSSRAEAIVLFTKDSNVKIILEEAIKIGTKRTWIASDAWSTSRKILGLDNLSESGRIFGVTCRKKEMPGFLHYMDQLINQETTNASFFHNLLSKNPFCPSGKEDQDCSLFESNPIKYMNGQNCIYQKCLKAFIKQDESYETYSVYMAVNVIAQGLKGLLENQNGTQFPPSKLKEWINQLNFSVDNDTYMALKESAEVNLGYNILEWETKRPVSFRTIGTYEQSHLQLPGVVPENNTETQFHCFKSCKEGYELSQFIPDNACCKTCQACTTKYFSTDGVKCLPCQDSQNPQCVKAPDFLPWEDGFSITLDCFTTIGLVVTLIVIGLFAVYSHTPIVRAAGGHLCFPALISLLCCFASVFCFQGEPTDVNCKAGLLLFSLAFTLCISCILANLLQIYVGFAFKHKYADCLKRVNKPVVVVIACAGVQVILCVLWLVLHPPSREMENEVLACDEGSITLFVITHVYIALLCAACFLFAYKGRRLPDLYKNASFITVSMLIYLVVWIIFIPIYIKQHGKYERVIEASAILVSSCGILGCHFAPKCYILIWRKELNDANRIAEYIRKHYENKGIKIMS